MNGNLGLWNGSLSNGNVRVPGQENDLLSIVFSSLWQPSVPPLPEEPRHPPPPEGSVSRWGPSPAWADTGCCCRKRWGYHSHSSLHPSTHLSSAAAAAAAALPVAELSLCTVTSASSEHPAVARHLKPSHECLSFSPSGWLLFFKATVFHLLA